ncbi:6-pyruvoyl tetrahydrobiopterin synthase [Anthophora quadrimaculata]
MARPIAYLTRKEVISSCHRLHNEKLTEEDNKKIYGKCNNYWGHGHNYTGDYCCFIKMYNKLSLHFISVEVTVRGPVDSVTGMVMNLSNLKLYMKKVLMDQLDHKNLDKDVPYFKNVVSTTENVAIYIFNELKTIMPNPDLLYEVKIYETDKNIVIYRGEKDN